MMKIVAWFFSTFLFLQAAIAVVKELRRIGDALEASYSEQVAIRVELQRIANARDREVAIAIGDKIVR
jgi:hypothetical protein